MDTIFPIPVSERHGLTGWDNCEPCSGLMVANVACRGTKPATWDESQALRVASGVTTAQMGPWDMVRAFRARYGWSTSAFVGTQDQLIADLVAGKWGAINIWYSKWPYSLKIQKDFMDGHCLAIGPTDPSDVSKPGFLWIIDPLFVPGSGYKGEWVGIPTIKAAMDGALGLLLAPNEFVTPIDPKVRVATGTFTTYTVRDIANVLTVYGSSVRHLPINTAISVTPQEHPIKDGSTSVLMRMITAGVYEGLWVIAHGALPYSQ